MLKNDLLLRAARRERTERTPVWMMRQAGRFDPCYRALRERVNLPLEEMFRTPEVAAEMIYIPAGEIHVEENPPVAGRHALEEPHVQRIVPRGRAPVDPAPAVARHVLPHCGSADRALHGVRSRASFPRPPPRCHLNRWQ